MGLWAPFRNSNVYNSKTAPKQIMLCRGILSKTLRIFPTKNISTTPHLNTFWVSNEKGEGYDSKAPKPPLKERVREGLKELKQEVALWSEEWKERLESDPILLFRPGETDVIWDFKNEASINKWVASSDSDHGEGYSSCSFSLTNHSKGLFTGELNTRVPKDGRIARSGYCNIKTHRARKSFKRECYLDWSTYNMMVLRVRGDGRSYILNIGTKGYYDITWNDMYHYILFTRGGPYWQTARIPLSKFFLSSRGRIQDRQYPIPLNRITSFGISAGDKIDGPFQLEIDFVGLEFDPNHKEEFAYEMYKMESFIVAT